MPKPGKKPKAELRRGNRGQFLILSALTIVLVMIGFASLLARISVLGISLGRTNFREVTTEVTLNFRAAIAAAMAEVSRTLDLKASVTRYTNYTSLDEYPQAASEGYQFISDWQKNILQRYAGLGLNLSATQPIFQCEWNSSTGYSEASSDISLDILTYGFYGWTSEVTVRLNATILDLYANKTDGKTVAFYFSLLKENDVPVTDLAAEAVSVLYQHAESDEFTASKSVNLTYLGGGRYIAEFSMYSTTVQEGLNNIKDFATENMTDEDFMSGYNSLMLSARMDLVSAEYNASRLEEAYGNLTESRSWIYVNGGDEETTYILALIDLVRSQILPTVRVALQDSRGIVVGAARVFAVMPQDTEGPLTRNVAASPNPTGGASSVTLTAWIDDLSTGVSNIAGAEYFVNATGGNGTGTPMLALDGIFDSALEQVEVQINVSSWAPGDQIIYVHGKDAAGFWGEFGTITVTVTEPIAMYVWSIDMYLYPFRFFGWRLYQAEAVVTIVDIDGSPVAGAWVYGHWMGPPGDVQGATDGDGKVSFLSARGWGRRTFTFTVDNIVKSGYIYNPALNRETSDSIRAP